MNMLNRFDADEKVFSIDDISYLNPTVQMLYNYNLKKGHTEVVDKITSEMIRIAGVDAGFREYGSAFFETFNKVQNDYPELYLEHQYRTASKFFKNKPICTINTHLLQELHFSNQKFSFFQNVMGYNFSLNHLSVENLKMTHHSGLTSTGKTAYNLRQKQMEIHKQEVDERWENYAECPQIQSADNYNKTEKSEDTNKHKKNNLLDSILKSCHSWEEVFNVDQLKTVMIYPSDLYFQFQVQTGVSDYIKEILDRNIFVELYKTRYVSEEVRKGNSKFYDMSKTIYLSLEEKDPTKLEDISWVYNTTFYRFWLKNPDGFEKFCTMSVDDFGILKKLGHYKQVIKTILQMTGEEREEKGYKFTDIQYKFLEYVLRIITWADIFHSLGVCHDDLIQCPLSNGCFVDLYRAICNDPDAELPKGMYFVYDFKKDLIMLFYLGILQHNDEVEVILAKIDDVIEKYKEENDVEDVEDVGDKDNKNPLFGLLMIKKLFLEDLPFIANGMDLFLHLPNDKRIDLHAKLFDIYLRYGNTNYLTVEADYLNTRFYLANPPKEKYNDEEVVRLGLLLLFLNISEREGIEAELEYCHALIDLLTNFNTIKSTECRNMIGKNLNKYLETQEFKKMFLGCGTIKKQYNCKDPSNQQHIEHAWNILKKQLEYEIEMVKDLIKLEDGCFISNVNELEVPWSIKRSRRRTYVDHHKTFDINWIPAKAKKESINDVGIQSLLNTFYHISRNEEDKIEKVVKSLDEFFIEFPVVENPLENKEVEESSPTKKNIFFNNFKSPNRKNIRNLTKDEKYVMSKLFEWVFSRELTFNKRIELPVEYYKHACSLFNRICDQTKKYDFFSNWRGKNKKKYQTFLLHDPSNKINKDELQKSVDSLKRQFLIIDKSSPKKRKKEEIEFEFNLDLEDDIKESVKKKVKKGLFSPVCCGVCFRVILLDTQYLVCSNENCKCRFCFFNNDIFHPCGFSNERANETGVQMSPRCSKCQFDSDVVMFSSN